MLRFFLFFVFNLLDTAFELVVISCVIGIDIIALVIVFFIVFALTIAVALRFVLLLFFYLLPKKNK